MFKGTLDSGISPNTLWKKRVPRKPITRLSEQILGEKLAIGVEDGGASVGDKVMDVFVNTIQIEETVVDGDTEKALCADEDAIAERSLNWAEEVDREENFHASAQTQWKKFTNVRPWTTDLDTVRLVKSVLLWIRLHRLGLQYWASKTLSALVSTIGTPIMVDKFTKDRTRIQFARVVVEIDISESPPRSLWYFNEVGQLVDQAIDYEWLPTKCKNCSSFGHIQADCRKTEIPVEKKLGVTKKKSDLNKEVKKKIMTKS
uniref:CCHC-type domain-containing protein n=1 Tax=Cannabis sativa TaxID=3483 RepID=A0A803P0M5_CANSA